MSVKGKIVRLFSRLLTNASVVSAEEFGGFRKIVLKCDVEPPAPGTKVQLLLPTDDMRTYTPLPHTEGLLLLGWKHVDGPGAKWVADVKPGDELQFVGPQRSLELDDGPVILVGDETSVAVAASYAVARPGQVHAVIQSDAGDDVREAAQALGLEHVDVVAPGDHAATVDSVVSRMSKRPGAIVALTGGSEFVVGVRNGLCQAGVKEIQTKTYWVPGKTGLD